MGIQCIGNDPQSNITVWIKAQPTDPNAYATIPDPPLRESPSPPPLHSKRRRTLQEMSDMNVNREPEKRRRKSPSKVDGHNRESERLSLTSEQQPQEQQQTDEGLPFDMHATPRASSNIGAPLNLTAPLYAVRGRVASSLSRSSASSSSAAAARSASPVKRIGDLQLLGVEINFVNFDNIDMPLSKAGRELYTTLRRVFAKSQVIPFSMRAKANDLVANFEIDDSNFYQGTHPLLPVQPKTAFNDQETWTLVGEAIKRARMCEEDLAPEAQWNTQVHARIFDVVLEGWREERGLWYMDVTSARIYPSPTSINPASGNKLIDFAIIFSPSRPLHKQITGTLKSRSETTINHTRAEHLRYKPLVINFETKKPGEGAEGANVQLGVWAGAHFRRLRELAQYKAQLEDVILPCVMVQGHDWFLKIASLARDEEVVLHGDLLIGSTRSILGTYKLLAALRMLCSWAVEVYRPWFVECCLLQT